MFKTQRGVVATFAALYVIASMTMGGWVIGMLWLKPSFPDDDIRVRLLFILYALVSFAFSVPVAIIIWKKVYETE